jgi:predicted membrane-bound dolichyl-phosphate-mannose-protein mannosyltransferase
MAVFPSGNIYISTQTILLVAMIGIVLAVPLYSTVLEQMEEISPTMVMLSPLLLLILIRWLSQRNAPRSFFFNDVDPSAIHRVGGSPVGVAFILVLVLLMIWYQSSGEDESEE